MAENGHLTLSELAGLIRAEIEEWSSRTGDVLVVAEVSEIRRSPGGHWFLSLVERRDEGVVAEMRAVIWQRQAGSLDRFREATGTPVASGMELLLRGRVGYHERYGLRFDVLDIDAGYTLGEMQRRRREVIERLKREGLIERNKALRMAVVPQRIAVVSSETAAGYGDFVRHLGDNPYGYAFTVRLFPALMQGDGSEASVSGCFDRIAVQAPAFDVVVLIRGGGSQVDLSCFDTYGIAGAISRCPVPVITGLGHERDESVADMVAHTRVKTPTAAAQVIVERVRAFEERMEDAWLQVSVGARRTLETANGRYALIASRFALAAKDVLAAERTDLDDLLRALTAALPRTLDRCEASLGLIRQRLRTALVTVQTERHVHARLTSRLAIATRGAVSRHEDGVNQLARRMTGYALRVVHRREPELVSLSRSLQKTAIRAVQPPSLHLAELATMLGLSARSVLHSEYARTDALRRDIAHLDPAGIMKRGFSITRFQGKCLTSADGLLLGDEIETLLADGRVLSRVFEAGGSDEKG